MHPSYGDTPTPAPTSANTTQLVHDWMQALPADRFTIGEGRAGFVLVTAAEIATLARSIVTPTVTA